MNWRITIFVAVVSLHPAFPEARISDVIPPLGPAVSLIVESASIKTMAGGLIGNAAARLQAQSLAKDNEATLTTRFATAQLLTSSANAEAMNECVTGLVELGSNQRDAARMLIAVQGLLAGIQGMSLTKYLGAVDAWNKFWDNAPPRVLVAYHKGSEVSRGAIMLRMIRRVLNPAASR